MKNLTILNTSIRTLNNLYSLNDLHIASGNDPKHRPTFFIRNEQTQALISELNAEKVTCENSHSSDLRSSVLFVKNGVGTYACQELVIAYAAWISAAFHFKVIRAFMAFNGITQQPQQNLPLAEADADEEAIRIIANLYHSLNGAYEMGVKIRKEYPHLGRDIDKFIGGHYLYNLNMPTENALERARKYVQAKSVRIMFIKGMLSLLEQQPQPKRLTNF